MERNTKKYRENGMKSRKVTDPNILAQLNGGPKKVTDPALLAQLNSSNQEEEEEIPYTPPPESTGWGAIGEDVKGIPGKILDYGVSLGQKIPESWEQVYNKPGRALKNFAAGIGEYGIGALNLPHETFKYLGEKNVIPDWLKKYNDLPFTHIPDLGVEKYLGIDKPEPGDELIRNMLMFAGAPKIAGSIPGGGNFMQRIKNMGEHGPLTNKLEELEASHAGATAEHAGATQQYNALKDYMESLPGFESSNPNVLQRKALEAEQNLSLLRQQSEAVPEHLRATEEPIAPETSPLSIVEPVRAEQIDVKGIPKTEVSDAALRQAEQQHEAAQAQTAQHAENISQHLGKGNAHNKRVAQKLNPILEAKQAEIGAGFDKYIKGLEGKNVMLSNPREAKAIYEDIQNRAKLGDVSSQEVYNLLEEYADPYKNVETMPANKFVSAYRSLKKRAQETRSSAYGKSSEEFDRLIERANDMDDIAKRMESVMDNGLGPENLEELNGLKKRYATEVAPLFKNKFYQYMRANNIAPKNMIAQLQKEPYVRSTNPNKVTGSQILNDIIKNDSELLQNVVGERFAKEPHKLHAWDEEAHPYIENMPELKNMRQQHFDSMQAEHQRKADLQRVEDEHRKQKEEATAKHNAEVAEAKQKNIKASEEAAEQTRLKKEQTHKENLEKQKEHAEKAKYFKMQQEIKALEERATKLKSSAEKLQAKAKAKNMSLKQKLDIEQELSKTKKRLAQISKDIELKKRLFKVAGRVGIGIAFGVPAFNKVTSMIGGK
jgi:hypothetical protein